MKKLLIWVLILSNLAWAGDVEDGAAAYEQGNYELAFTKLKLAADQGFAKAQYYLGEMHYTGKGAMQNDAEAAKWYKLAADQGHVDAQYYLGVMYEHGLGVTQNYAEAVKWYKLAADQGLSPAQNNLLWMYRDDRVMQWFKKAAAQGYAPAQEILKRNGG